MKTCLLVIVLLTVAAVAVMSDEQKVQCPCDEDLIITVKFHKEDLSDGDCGTLVSNNCSMAIKCNLSGIAVTLDPSEMKSVCSNHNTTVLHYLDNSPANITLECSDDKEAHLEVDSQTKVLRIPNICSENSNGTSPGLTTAEVVRTTENNTDSTEATTGTPPTAAPTGSQPSTAEPTAAPSGTPLTTEIPASKESRVTSDHPHVSGTTQTSNSSYDTTESIPSGNHTERTTTPGLAVSFRMCSGLLVVMLAVSSLV